MSKENKKIRIVFKDNSYMTSCGLDHTIECEYYMLTDDNAFLMVISDDVEAWYPISSVLFFEDLSKMIGR